MNSTLIPSTSPSYYISSEPENVVISCISASLSVIGTLFIIITYFLWKDIQGSSRRILVFISLADFGYSVGNIVGLISPPNRYVCLVQSIIGTFFILCSFFWTVFLAVYLFIACTRKNLIMAERAMGLFHLIAWGVPCAIVCAGSFEGKFGNNGDVVSSGWCWIDTHNTTWNDQILWMLLAGKFWEVSAFLTIAVLYFLIKRGMRLEFKMKAENMQLSDRSSKAAQKAERKLILVPLTFVILRIWGTARFFIYVIHGKSDIKWLIIMQGIGDNLPGFCNFLIFCLFTEKVLGQIRMMCGNCCYKLCPGMLVRVKKTGQKKYDKLNSGVCQPISTSSPDYKTFENSPDEELCASSTSLN